MAAIAFSIGLGVESSTTSTVKVTPIIVIALTGLLGSYQLCSVLAGGSIHQVAASGLELMLCGSTVFLRYSAGAELDLILEGSSATELNITMTESPQPQASELKMGNLSMTNGSTAYAGDSRHSTLLSTAEAMSWAGVGLVACVPVVDYLIVPLAKRAWPEMRRRLMVALLTRQVNARLPTTAPCKSEEETEATTNEHSVRSSSRLGGLVELSSLDSGKMIADVEPTDGLSQGWRNPRPSRRLSSSLTQSQEDELHREVSPRESSEATASDIAAHRPSTAWLAPVRSPFNQWQGDGAEALQSSTRQIHVTARVRTTSDGLEDVRVKLKLRTFVVDASQASQDLSRTSCCSRLAPVRRLSQTDRASSAAGVDNEPMAGCESQQSTLVEGQQRNSRASVSARPVAKTRPIRIAPQLADDGATEEAKGVVRRAVRHRQKRRAKVAPDVFARLAVAAPACPCSESAPATSMVSSAVWKATNACSGGRLQQTSAMEELELRMNKPVERIDVERLEAAIERADVTGVTPEKLDEARNLLEQAVQLQSAKLAAMRSRLARPAKGSSAGTDTQRVIDTGPDIGTRDEPERQSSVEGAAHEHRSRRASIVTSTQSDSVHARRASTRLSLVMSLAELRAVTKLQASFRGHLARKEVKKKRMIMTRARTTLKKAGTLVISMLRWAPDAVQKLRFARQQEQLTLPKMKVAPLKEGFHGGGGLSLPPLSLTPAHSDPVITWQRASRNSLRNSRSSRGGTSAPGPSRARRGSSIPIWRRGSVTR